jgi:hypothetical protein
VAEVDAGAICQAPTSVAWELERSHNSLSGTGKRSAFECGEFRGWLYKSTSMVRFTRKPQFKRTPKKGTEYPYFGRRRSFAYRIVTVFGNVLHTHFW